MTLEQGANLAEILGVIVVVVTLIYLSVQVRQGAMSPPQPVSLRRRWHRTFRSTGGCGPYRGRQPAAR